jgi:hypothetical protein
LRTQNFGVNQCDDHHCSGASLADPPRCRSRCPSSLQRCPTFVVVFPPPPPPHPPPPPPPIGSQERRPIVVIGNVNAPLLAGAGCDVPASPVWRAASSYPNAIGGGAWRSFLVPLAAERMSSNGSGITNGRRRWAGARAGRSRGHVRHPPLHAPLVSGSCFCSRDI